LGSIENFIVYLFLPWLRDEEIPFSPLDLPDDMCFKKYLDYKLKDRLLYFCDELQEMKIPPHGMNLQVGNIVLSTKPSTGPDERSGNSSPR
jgi:hypothetical protein